MAYAGRLGETLIEGGSAAMFIYAMERAGFKLERAGHEFRLDCRSAIHMKRPFQDIKRLGGRRQGWKISSTLSPMSRT